MPEQFFIIDGQHLGSCRRYPLTANKQRPISYACFCPVCADVWARAGIPGEAFFVFHIPCRRHTFDGISVPGSLWPVGDSDFLDSLPPLVLRREFLLHLDHYESKQ